MFIYAMSNNVDEDDSPIECARKENFFHLRAINRRQTLYTLVNSPMPG